MSDLRPIQKFRHRHLLGIEGLSAEDILILLDRAEGAVEVSRQIEKKRTTLRGRTLINLFFEFLHPDAVVLRACRQEARRRCNEHVGADLER